MLCTTEILSLWSFGEKCRKKNTTDKEIYKAGARNAKAKPYLKVMVGRFQGT